MEEEDIQVPPEYGGGEDPDEAFFAKSKPVKRTRKGRFKCRQAVFTIQKTSAKTWSPEQLVGKKGIRYISGQWEKAPKTGSVHFQGYVQFDKQQQSRKAVMALLEAKCWCQNARGSLEQNQQYVSKTDWMGKGNRLEGTEAFEWGFPVKCDPSGKGSKRRDLEKIRKDILDGKKILDIANEKFGTWTGAFRAIAKFKCMVDQKNSPDFRKITVEVYYGQAGSHKSRRAMEAAIESGQGYYRPVINNSGQVWFSNYNGEKTLIFDDFYGQVRFSYMLRLLDGYRMEIESKGGSVYAAWDRVFITSNVHPRKWWRSYEKIPAQSVKGMIRRITKITECVNRKADEIEDWVEQTTVDKKGKSLENIHPCKRRKLGSGRMKVLLGTIQTNSPGRQSIPKPKWGGVEGF